MRSPRRIVLTDEMIARYDLSTQPPPSDSLFWAMWNSSLEIAQQALQTAFVQGIKIGNLDPVRYGGFNINDAFYCFNGAPDYQIAAQRSTDPTLKAFLTLKYNNSQRYNATFPLIWRVKDGGSIVPFDVCFKHSEFEAGIGTNEAI